MRAHTIHHTKFLSCGQKTCNFSGRPYSQSGIQPAPNPNPPLKLAARGKPPLNRKRTRVKLGQAGWAMRTGWEMRKERLNRVIDVRGECPARVPRA